MAGTPVPADPWSAGFMATASVATAALAKPTMTAQQSTGSTSFDNSGWNVNLGFGGGATMATTTDRSMSALGASAVLNNPRMLLLLAVGVYFLMGRK
jgi:hypothetical protein